MRQLTAREKRIASMRRTKNMLNIKRERYVIINTETNSIFCGLAREYKFKPIDNIGDTAIKTYLSEKKAKSSFLNSWWDSKESDFDAGKYKVVKVMESICDEVM